MFEKPSHNVPSTDSKLKIDKPDDQFEREADTVANRIMMMPNPSPLPASPNEEKETFRMEPFSADNVQMKCSRCKEETIQPEPTSATIALTVQPQDEKEEEELFRAKKISGRTHQFSANLEKKIGALKGSGRALSETNRSFFEPRFGTHFNEVRVHTNSRATKMAKEINARAFTVGRNIVFGKGEYSPHSEEGNRLLGHELTHIIQQRRGNTRSNTVQRANGDDEEENVAYPVKVPKNIKTEKQLDRYAEVLIFGKAMNIEWQQKGWDVTAFAREGKTVNYIYSRSFITKHQGKEPGEAVKPKATNRDFKKTKGKEREEINDEIDKRYWEGTGITEGEKIKTGEQSNIDQWNVYRDEVMNDKKELKKLPPELKKLMGGKPSFKPRDYDQLLRIAKKLNQFSPQDIAVYKMLALKATDDLNLFEKSVDMFLARKKELKEALEKYEKENKGNTPKTMQDAIEESWETFDSSKIGTLSEEDQYDLARQQTWKVTKAQLEYMKDHPGETAIDFAKTATLMNTNETFEGIGKDITEAASGDANAWARWAGGVGAGAKLSGWLLAVGGVLYVLSWLTGVGELATIAAFMGAMLASTIVLSTTESELRIKAASQAKDPEEFKREVVKAAVARTNVIIMLGLLALSLAIRFVAKTFFPETVAKISKTLARFKEKIRLTGKLSEVKSEFIGKMKAHKQQLREAGESAKKSAKTEAGALEKMELDEFINKLETGEGDFFQEASVQEGQKIPWRDLAETPEGLRAIKTYKAQLAETLRESVPEEIDRIVKDQTGAINAMLTKVEKATIPEEFEQAINEHEQFMSKEEVARRGKERELEVRREKADEALKQLKEEMKKADVARKAAESYPDTWKKFDEENHAEFEAELKEFRGEASLDPDPGLKGGEGWLFTSKKHPLQALKRWFKTRVSDMPLSILKLKQAKQAVEANLQLGEVIEVVDVHKVGSDWVLRDFDARTMPLKDAMKSSLSAEKARIQALEALEKVQEGIKKAAQQRRIAEVEKARAEGKKPDFSGREFYTPEEKTQTGILKDIQSKLTQNPANENLHYSGSKGKIIIIDMQ